MNRTSKQRRPRQQDNLQHTSKSTARGGYPGKRTRTSRHALATGPLVQRKAAFPDTGAPPASAGNAPRESGADPWAEFWNQLIAPEPAKDTTDAADTPAKDIADTADTPANDTKDTTNTDNQDSGSPSSAPVKPPAVGGGEHVPLPADASVADLDAILPDLGHGHLEQEDALAAAFGLQPSAGPGQAPLGQAPGTDAEPRAVIYVVWDTTPVRDKNNPWRYGRPLISEAQIQTIAGHVRSIYAKNNVPVLVKVISRKEHARKRLADDIYAKRVDIRTLRKQYRETRDPDIRMHLKRREKQLADLMAEVRAGGGATHYRKIDAWVEIKSDTSLTTTDSSNTKPATRFEGERVRSGHYRTESSRAFFTPGRTSTKDPLYSTGFDVAHEALHQLLNKAKYYVHGERVKKKNENDEETGHTNERPNLNMSAQWFMSKEHAGENPYALGPVAYLKKAERILPAQQELLYHFFRLYRFRHKVNDD